MTTLLEVVQDLMAATSDAEVNSIFDTVESEQIARVVKDCYNTLLVDMDIPDKKGLYELDASGTSTKPVYMTMPSIAKSLEWLKYDCRTSTDTNAVWKELKYLPLETFIEMTYNTAGDAGVSSFSITLNNASVDIYYKTDSEPTYYTSVDDYAIIFDSFDNSVDSTIQKNKTLGFGSIKSVFQLTDNWVIPLNFDNLQILIQEAKTQVFNEQKQIQNDLSAKKARTMKIRSISRGQAIKPQKFTYNIGRRGFK